MDEQPASKLPSTFDDGDVYDLVGKDIPYGLDFYVGLAREANGPVLDIACGTGRILLPCLQAGVDIEGLDLFEPMLKTLRAKAAALGLSPRLHQADMSDFALTRRFALIMIPFNAFIHNMTQEAQIRCLQLCREHLLPDGKLTFDTFFPSPEIVGLPANTTYWRGKFRIPKRACRFGCTIRAASTAWRSTTLAERNRASERRRRRPNRSSLGDQLPLYLQERDGVFATRGRLCAMGDLGRFRRPPARARERRDGRDGVERVSRRYTEPRVHCATLGYGESTRLGPDCSTTKLAIWASMVTVGRISSGG